MLWHTVILETDMAFCTNCGATINGSFCQQCGRPAGAPSAEAAPPPIAGPRKTSPIIWVLGILFALFALGTLAVVGTGMFVVHKAKQAGFDPDLIHKNPGLALSKMVAAANPDLTVLNVNESKGIITVREKSTGKVVTLNFDDVKNGKIVVQDNSEGKSATMQFGAGPSKLPSWLPAYPGAAASGVFAINSGDGEGGTFSYTSNDAPAKVIAFYQDALQRGGFKITTTATTPESSVLAAEDESSHRNVMVTVAGESGKTTVNLVYGVKK
jgi:hypothetical protein